MNISSFLKPELVNLDIDSNNLEEILLSMTTILKEKNLIENEKKVLKKLLERERLGSTAIGYLSAVPHAKLKELKAPLISISITNKEINYGNNGEQVRFILLILSPQETPIVHLQILAASAAFLRKSKEILSKILKEKDKEKIISILKSYESEES